MRRNSQTPGWAVLILTGFNWTDPSAIVLYCPSEIEMKRRWKWRWISVCFLYRNSPNLQLNSRISSFLSIRLGGNRQTTVDDIHLASDSDQRGGAEEEGVILEQCRKQLVKREYFLVKQISGRHLNNHCYGRKHLLPLSFLFWMLGDKLRLMEQLQHMEQEHE